MGYHNAKVQRSQKQLKCGTQGAASDTGAWPLVRSCTSSINPNVTLKHILCFGVVFFFYSEFWEFEMCVTWKQYCAKVLESDGKCHSPKSALIMILWRTSVQFKWVCSLTSIAHYCINISPSEKLIIKNYYLIYAKRCRCWAFTAKLCHVLWKLQET